MKMKSIDAATGVENPAGIVRKTLAFNDEAMLCHFELKKDSAIPLHNHRATQIGYVIRGHVRFLADSTDDEFEVRTGDSYVFGAFVKHGAEILEDSEFVEVFVPVRDEYRDA